MIWHVAFAVADLDDAMDQFGAALSLEWRPVKHYQGTTTDEFGVVHSIDTRLTFSVAGPCALEIFEANPGTPNAPAEGTIFHHLGYWADDLPAESERLQQHGWVCAGGPASVDARAMFHRGPLGVFIEACNVAARRPGLEKYYPSV